MALEYISVLIIRFINILLMPITRENGNMINLMAREYSLMKMEISIREISKII